MLDTPKGPQVVGETSQRKILARGWTRLQTNRPSHGLLGTGGVGDGAA